MIKKSILNNPKLFSKSDRIEKKTMHSVEKLRYIEFLLKNNNFLFLINIFRIS